jgi:hypothetical protein
MRTTFTGHLLELPSRPWASPGHCVPRRQPPMVSYSQLRLGNWCPHSTGILLNRFPPPFIVGLLGIGHRRRRAPCPGSSPVSSAGPACSAGPRGHGPCVHCANGSCWHCAAGPPLDSARWLWKSFPFSDLDSICCKLQNLCKFEFNSENCETNFIE